MAMQGLPFDAVASNILGVPDLGVLDFTNATLVRFAGNAMCIPCVGSVICWALHFGIAGNEANTVATLSPQGVRDNRFNKESFTLSIEYYIDIAYTVPFLFWRKRVV